METQICTKFDESEFHHVFFDLEAMIGFNQPITAIVVCTVGINIFEPCAFDLEVQRFMARANPGRIDPALGSR
jgi:hypothetical protein